MLPKPVTVAIVGAGHRSVLYASYAQRHPERMRVEAVAEPNEARREWLADLHGVPRDRRFCSFEELAARPRLADAVINGTMDRMHHQSSVPFLELGYHLLLEKPIATTENEVRDLIALAQRRSALVMICHVLRYAPLYVCIKKLLMAGEIGEPVSMRTAENVSYHHMATGFVRGRWSRRDHSNPMLLAKCCHDLDLITWIFSGTSAKRVASFGSLTRFHPRNAPAGSTKRCLDGCSIEHSCPYSARLTYIDQGFWGIYAWEGFAGREPTLDEKLASLRADNPYGRCVWHCDNDVVDHQSVLIEFANGATATHDMFCAASRPSRTIHIIGTNGEIEGDMEAGTLLVRRPSLRPGSGYDEIRHDIAVKGDGHGGGDLLLIEDFVKAVRGETSSLGHTRIEDSLDGHLIAFAADHAMRERRVIEIIR